ncbi:carbohydrate ABC transporter membrane protein 1, CUT1 family [Caldicoprobacter faecalis]|uniref:Carbohydrate ABC transporter membrane protein 1, CUT1 family n=2 Tax=Caldicoprobacter faecalis TaxID=937334 RepID=A0A1I5YNZ6_9FIRM|nr:ABC transporter permease subunit [Caldicoprobacter faecalis]SFQ45969.1 carbohydrate ABC transporter membrane protein 1, CUT1 family [Caldicoprobacter faecalis]
MRMQSTASNNVIISPNSKQFFRRLKEQKYLYMMVIPGVIWMIIFNYIPMYGIIIAFKDYNIISSFFEAPWVGFKHFLDFFRDDWFPIIMKNTVGISLLKLIFGFPLPIIFALFLNEIQNSTFKRTVQTISYLPHFLSWVVLGGILITWLSESGMINELLVNMGILDKPVAFLGEPKYFWWIATISDIWKGLGWNSIIYLAAISGVDVELYESAIVDGAGRFRRMWSITLPSISGTIAILFILAVSGLLNSNFDQILVLRNPLNAPSSEVIDIFVYRMGIQSARFSYATAVGLFKSVIALMLLLLANWVTRKLTGKSLF